MSQHQKQNRPISWADWPLVCRAIRSGWNVKPGQWVAIGNTFSTVDPTTASPDVLRTGRALLALLKDLTGNSAAAKAASDVPWAREVAAAMTEFGRAVQAQAKEGKRVRRV